MGFDKIQYSFSIPKSFYRMFFRQFRFLLVMEFVHPLTLAAGSSEARRGQYQVPPHPSPNAALSDQTTKAAYHSILLVLCNP